MSFGIAPAGQHHVGAVDVDGRTLDVSVTIEFDVLEYVGRLWFEDATEPGTALSDRAAIPGATPDAVVARARRLTPEQLVQRYRRGLHERRRFRPLRKVTSEILGKIRRLNRIATSMRAGLMDGEEAALEIAMSEIELHALVEQLRDAAGDDGEPAA